MIPKVTSPDLLRAQALHKRFPGIIQRTFPRTIRSEIKPFKANIKGKMQGLNWPRGFKFSKGAKAIDTHKMKTKKIKKHNRLGIELTPSNQGAAAIFEKGTKVRTRKSGGKTGQMAPKPAFEPSWRAFQTSAKTTVKSNFISITDLEVRKEMTKLGLRWL